MPRVSKLECPRNFREYDDYFFLTLLTPQGGYTHFMENSYERYKNLFYVFEF